MSTHATGGTRRVAGRSHGPRQLFAEAWPVELNPERFRSDEARLKVLARTAGILGDLEMAVRRELGADRIPPNTGPSRSGTG
jgi:hypothetical protein